MSKPQWTQLDIVASQTKWGKAAYRLLKQQKAEIERLKESLAMLSELEETRLGMWGALCDQKDERIGDLKGEVLALKDENESLKNERDHIRGSCGLAVLFSLVMAAINGLLLWSLTG